MREGGPIGYEARPSASCQPFPFILKDAERKIKQLEATKDKLEMKVR